MISRRKLTEQERLSVSECRQQTGLLESEHWFSA